MKRRIGYFLLFVMVGVFFCIAMTGCCFKHEFAEATCTKPKTCVKCGKTEGEALGHEWIEATCTKPKTCSVCGATEGAALGHNVLPSAYNNPCTHEEICAKCGEVLVQAPGHVWEDATYFKPMTCSMCGEKQGEVKRAFFVQNNLPIRSSISSFESNAIWLDSRHNIDPDNLPEDVNATECKTQISFKEVYTTFSDRAGYEKVMITTVHHFNNSPNNSYIFLICELPVLVDYYTGFCLPNGGNTEMKNRYTASFSVDDMEVKCYYSIEDTAKWEKGGLTVTYKIEIEKPKGYDGLVLEFRNVELDDFLSDSDPSINSYSSGEIISPNEHRKAAFFRLY